MLGTEANDNNSNNKQLIRVTSIVRLNLENPVLVGKQDQLIEGLMAIN